MKYGDVVRFTERFKKSLISAEKNCHTEQYAESMMRDVKIISVMPSFNLRLNEMCKMVFTDFGSFEVKQDGTSTLGIAQDVKVFEKANKEN